MNDMISSSKYFFVVILLVHLSCGTSKSNFTVEQMDALETLVKKQKFHVESDWAYPQVTVAMQQVLDSRLLQPGSTAGNISLVGNYNFLKMTGDSISSFLPYFGERQMQVAYGGGDSAIELSGLMKNYKAEKNRNNGYTITFDAASNHENFNVSIEISPSLKTNMIFTGPSRFPISYSGTAQANIE